MQSDLSAPDMQESFDDRHQEYPIKDQNCRSFQRPSNRISN